MVLNHGMHFHPSLLARLRMTAYAFEDVVKECDGGGIHHVEQFLPILWLMCLPLITLKRAAIR